MSSTTRRTVITGIGLINPLGLSTAAVWHGLSAGQSGIGPIKAFDAANLPVRIGGEVRDFDAKNFLAKDQRKQIKVMARGIQLAVAAAQVALDDGQLDKSKLDPTRFGIEFASGLLATELKDLAAAAQLSYGNGPKLDMDKWGAEGIRLVEPLWMLKYLPNFLASHISILHNAQGPNNTITQSDVAGLLALGEAQRILQRDQADFFIVGGAESKINPLTMTRMCLFAPLSKRNDAPAQASRPFDRQRDGFVVAEGAAVLLVEELEHAKRRGARISAEVSGFGSAFDRQRDGRGLARAIHAALVQADIGPDDVDHVNANGLGTPQADAWEARAIREVFGERPVPVFAAKGAVGNLGAGSGLTEMAFSILAGLQGTLPATRNCDDPDPACPVAVNRQPHRIARPHFLKIGFNETGQCAAVVCRRWEGQS
jgi:3-oxoacyl-[acyl-carrier-protein] synthase II